MSDKKVVLCFPGVGLATYLRDHRGKCFGYLLNNPETKNDLIYGIKSWNALVQAAFVPWAPGRHLYLLEHNIDFYSKMGKYPDLQVGYLTEQTRLNFDKNSENTPLLCGGDAGFILYILDIISSIQRAMKKRKN